MKENLMLMSMAKGIKSKDIDSQSEKLKALARHVAAGAREVGLATASDGCRTVCEEQLVVINGKLQRKVVCRVVCPT
jgi:hypothetical protein